MDTMRPKGFTLVELMAALAVAAILAAVAVPGMTLAWQRANTLQALHATTSSLALARSLAVSRGHPVTLCPSHDGTSCSGGQDWSRGWIVFLDSARTLQPGSQDLIVETAGAIRGNLALRSTAGRSRIRYLPHGWASGSNASLHLCSGNGSEDLLATIVINNAGRTRTERPTEKRPCPGS